MNLKLINEFCENEKIETPLLIKNVVKGVANNGKPYLSVTFQDKTGTIDGKVWDASGDVPNHYGVGKIGIVNAEVLKYRDALQLKILNFQEVDQTKINDMGRFIPVSGVDKEELVATVTKYIDVISDETLHTVTKTIVEGCFDEFFSYPAASKNHHEFMHGLATHVYGMLKLGEAMCDLYPLLNRDLLYAGIILHDVGKVYELSGPVTTEYTMQGKLLGHISIMQAIVYETARKLGYDNEQVILLRHMILSHHGQYEFGSPVLPMIPEAEILNYIDNIDARMHMFTKIVEPLEKGTFSGRNFSLENRQIYKASFDKEDK